MTGDDHPPMRPLTRVTLSERAAAELLAQISAGRWAVGTTLPGEAALAAELSVGRSTVREAIRRLAARGVLSTRQGVGVFLVATTPSEPWDDMARLAAITEVLQVRVAIETRAAALAALHHDAPDAAAIRDALAAREACDPSDPVALATIDIALHRSIVASCGNALLVALFDGIRERLVASMTDLLRLLPDGFDDTDEHYALVAAVLARDADRAESLARAHLLRIDETVRSTS